MKKQIKILLLLLIAMMMTFICYLLFENSTYQRQIDERDKLIHQMLITDSISMQLLNVSRTDSSVVYRYDRDDAGNILTYDDLSNLMRHYRKEADLKDMIILDAKRIYKFDYSIKESGDTISMKFWSKPNK